MKKQRLLTPALLTIAVCFILGSCNKTNSELKPQPSTLATTQTNLSSLATQTPTTKVMAWWGGFNSIKMPLDSVPKGVDQIHLFLIDLDARPNVALDTTHIIMQGFSWSSIIAAAHRLQARGIKVVATILGQRGANASPGQYGIPAAAYPKAFAFGAITDPQAFAATIKKRVIDDWGLDGIDLDVEDGFGGEAAAYNVTLNRDSTSYTVSSASAANTTNAANFFAALGKYFGPKSGSGKLLIIDRGPNPNYIVPATYQYFDEVIMQAYNWYDATSITNAYNSYKSYFSASQMFFTLTASRAPDGWDENPNVIPGGFYFQGSQKTASQAAAIATKYASIVLPGQTNTINTGEYQISGDWSLGFPMLKPMLSAKTNTSTTTSGVQFYQDYNYSGTATQLIPKGSYTLSQLQSYGFVNDWASSVKIPSGWTVIMYADDNFSGQSWTLTANNSQLGSLSPSANDKVTSVKIQ